MRTQEMYDLMSKTDSHLEGRAYALSILREEEKGFDFLFKYTFVEDDPIQAISSYILDDYLCQCPLLIEPCIVKFVEQIATVKNESVKRIVSKILIRVLTKQKELLNKELKEKIVEYSLSWLVDGSKVATEANAMELLTKLRKEYAEAFAIGAEMIEINYYSRSIAYQNKGKKYLALHKKN
ncbi:MAG: hypothetical protein LBI72_04510 [Flavobacteriaceae bacterium]|jgi:hypothetical protein|nr:hypothetical protein [Flavobacteriaceae bacterium]